MNIIYKSFDQLLPEELYHILRLRQAVFIMEQDCMYSDIDGNDPQAFHLMMNNGEGLKGYLRIFAPGIKSEETTMGRIVIDKSRRGIGLGKELIESGISICFRDYPDSAIRIEAQAGLTEYYQAFGFEKDGELYVWDGIDHISMVKDRSS